MTSVGSDSDAKAIVVCSSRILLSIVYALRRRANVMFLPHVGIVSALVHDKKQFLTNETILRIY